MAVQLLIQTTAKSCQVPYVKIRLMGTIIDDVSKFNCQQVQLSSTSCFPVLCIMQALWDMEYQFLSLSQERIYIHLLRSNKEKSGEIPECHILPEQPFGSTLHAGKFLRYPLMPCFLLPIHSCFAQNKKHCYSFQSSCKTLFSNISCCFGTSVHMCRVHLTAVSPVSAQLKPCSCLI